MRTIQAFVQELEAFCYTTAFLTVHTDEAMTLTLHRQGARVEYNGGQRKREEIVRFLAVSAKNGCSLVLRSITKERDADSDLAIKEIRGYALKHALGFPIWIKLTGDEMRDAYTQDAVTGEYLPAGPDVVFP